MWLSQARCAQKAIWQKKEHPFAFGLNRCRSSESQLLGGFWLRMGPREIGVQLAIGLSRESA